MATATMSASAPIGPTGEPPQFGSPKASTFGMSNQPASAPVGSVGSAGISGSADLGGESSAIGGGLRFRGSGAVGGRNFIGEGRGQNLMQSAKQATVRTADKAQDTLHRLVQSDERRRWLGFLGYHLLVSFPMAWMAAAWVFFSAVILFLVPFWPVERHRASLQKWIGYTWKNLSLIHMDIMQFMNSEDPNKRVSSGFEHLQRTEQAAPHVESPMSFVLYFGVINPVVATVAFWTVLVLTILTGLTFMTLLPITGAVSKQFFTIQLKLADDVLLEQGQQQQQQQSQQQIMQ
jgi:hypothetical protein